MKDSVYSWRVSTARKAALEMAARRQNRSVADVLNEAVGQWLEQLGANDADESLEQELRRAAAAAFGRIQGGDPNRASQARDRLRRKLSSQLKRTR